MDPHNKSSVGINSFCMYLFHLTGDLQGKERAKHLIRLALILLKDLLPQGPLEYPWIPVNLHSKSVRFFVI